MTNTIKRILVLSILIQNIIFAQIKVTQLPQSSVGIFDAKFFDNNEYRSVLLLNTGWKVYDENEPDKKSVISVPAIFSGDESLVFERKILFTADQINNKQIKLGFFGINNSAEISINGYNIYKHSGGLYPFEISLPADILKPDANNTITVKVSSKFDSESTIPVAQRFLFSNSDGGIIRDAYIKFVSQVHVSNIKYNYTFDGSLSKAYLHFKVGIENSAFENKAEKQIASKEILVKASLFPNGTSAASYNNEITQVISSENQDVNLNLELAAPQLWSPASPNFYNCELIVIADGQVVDKTTQAISFFQLKKENNGLALNKSEFAFAGTTYLLNETDLRSLNVYQKIKDDLTLIKYTGFNAVRFSMYYPHPYALKICQELGLFAFVELPINSVPEEIFSRNEYLPLAENALSSLVNGYSKFSNAAIFGVGSSFLPNSPVTENFISSLAKSAAGKNVLSYASFVGIQTSVIDGLNFYGVELYSPELNSFDKIFEEANQNLGKGSTFISEVSYPNYKGGSSGYLTKYSSEAQAKFYETFLNSFSQSQLSGFFINSLFKYRGTFASLYAGNLKNNLYSIGILDYSRNQNDIAYKVLYSKLNKTVKVTIPIGAKKDDSPLSFIIFALALAVFMGVLINTKKKFREDCTRALLRPYNFFADVRDNRIMSGVHTVIMMLIEAGALSLLITIFLYFFKTNILFEKILLAFGSGTLMNAFSYLCWNPQICFGIFFGVVVIKFIALSIVIKIASFFIKTRVEYGSIFYSLIWSFLPLTLLLPLELILYKILGNGSLNIALAIFFAIYFIWLLQRMLKGIYVIFDVRPLAVYFYSLLVVIIVIGVIALKYQYSHSAIYYISNAIKQYNSMIF